MDVMQRPMTDAQVQYLVQLIDSRRNEAATKGAAPNGGGPGTPATPATPATRPAPVTAAAAPTDLPKKKPPPTVNTNVQTCYIRGLQRALSVGTMPI